METKHVFNKLGAALAVMTLVVNVIQGAVVGILMNVNQDIMKEPWFYWILLGVSFYLVGFPIFLIMTKNIPNSPKGDIKKISIQKIIKIFFICMAATYLFSMVGSGINYFIAILKGKDIVNPLASIVNSSNPIYTMIFAGILSPIIEEIIFRGVLLNKIRKFGDKTAIIVSALAFGLFHGNLSQFFYAFVLGMIFAYIALKTNTIRYTITLHIIINMFGSVLIPFLSSGNNKISASIAGALVIIFIIAGLILFFISRDEIHFEEVKTEKIDEKVETEQDKKSKNNMIYGNAGMISYFIICAFMFIAVILS